MLRKPDNGFILAPFLFFTTDCIEIATGLILSVSRLSMFLKLPYYTNFE